MLFVLLTSPVACLAGEDCDAIPPSGVIEVIRPLEMGSTSVEYSYRPDDPRAVCRFSMLSDEAIERGLTSDVPQYAIGCHWQKRLRAAIAIAIERSPDKPLCNHEKLSPADRTKINAEFAAFAEELARQLQTTLPPEVAEAFGRAAIAEICVTSSPPDSRPRSDTSNWRFLMPDFPPDAEFYSSSANWVKSRPFTILKSDWPAFDLSPSARFDPDPDADEAEVDGSEDEDIVTTMHVTLPSGVPFSVDDSVLDFNSTFTTPVAALDVGETYLVHCPYYDGFGEDPLLAVSKRTNMLEWVASVWVTSGWGAVTGIQPEPIVAYSKSGEDAIVVYTFATVGFSIERFSLTDGTALARFSPDIDLPLEVEARHRERQRNRSGQASEAGSDQPKPTPAAVPGQTDRQPVD